MSAILPFIVLISPSEIIAYSGGSATFLCLTSASFNTETILRIRWIIDEIPVENLRHDTEEEFFPHNGNSGRLRFTNVTLDLDRSRIFCAAEFQSGSIESSSNQSVLRVQGEAYRYITVHLRCFSDPCLLSVLCVCTNCSDLANLE